jgi:hypothetical protein
LLFSMEVFCIDIFLVLCSPCSANVRLVSHMERLIKVYPIT